jgi:hypothetical protein
MNDEKSPKKIRRKCYVKVSGGNQMIFMPDGQQIPMIRFTRVTHKAGQSPEAIIGILVDIE